MRRRRRRQRLARAVRYILSRRCALQSAAGPPPPRACACVCLSAAHALCRALVGVHEGGGGQAVCRVKKTVGCEEVWVGGRMYVKGMVLKGNEGVCVLCSQWGGGATGGPNIEFLCVGAARVQGCDFCSVARAKSVD